MSVEISVMRKAQTWKYLEKKKKNKKPCEAMEKMNANVRDDRGQFY